MDIRVQMPKDTSSVSVGGESFTPDADGIITLKSPEQVGPLVASGGIPLDENGEPGQVAGLIGTDSLPATIEMGDGRDSIQLGTLVAETQARSGISVDQWNNLPQQIRDILLQSHLAERRGELVRLGEEDPRVAEQAAKIEELNATIDELHAQIDETAVTPEGERPDFANMTKAKINEWLVSTGRDALTTGTHQDFVDAGTARYDELHPAS